MYIDDMIALIKQWHKIKLKLNFCDTVLSDYTHPCVKDGEIVYFYPRDRIRENKTLFIKELDKLLKDNEAFFKRKTDIHYLDPRISADKIQITEDEQRKLSQEAIGLPVTMHELVDLLHEWEKVN